ncbi:pyridoxamine 5'-phosphate oxidase family protein [Amycolatopsis anabasis]|uniref:pyridoxamine 5'-phosphate oxidase family protein n=1 Tax=Amycolatopsis anabasis TaxID=1840409 RepID=UPI00131C0F9E|nr:pyridoxamine 5'-phosphate oxidase family protein [Amycolatopsis anabasis]
MTTWQQFEGEQPVLAAKVRARLGAYKHHVLGTIRRDGRPRLSGTEVDFFGPDLVLGAMSGGMKSRDLRRDGRYSLHTNPGTETEMMEKGDAKLSGVAIEVTDPEVIQAPTDEPVPGPSDLFLLRLNEVVRTSIDPKLDAPLIELWHPGKPLRRFARYMEEAMPLDE